MTNKIKVNGEKAKEICNCSECTYKVEGDYCMCPKMASILQVMEWKDEQFEKEKQQWIERTAEWLKHNIYDYFYWIEMEGESEANIKDTLFDDFKKAAEEQL